MRNLTWKEQRLKAAYEKQQQLYVRAAIVLVVVGTVILPLLLGGE